MGKSMVIYNIKCTQCNAEYIGKTDCILSACRQTSPLTALSSMNPISGHIFDQVRQRGHINQISSYILHCEIKREANEKRKM